MNVPRRWIFLRIELHPFSRRNAILLYPLYAVGYWKISNDPESRSVEVTRGREVMIGWDTKRIASSGHYFTVKFNARWEIPFSAIFSIPVVFESSIENCNNKTDIEKLNGSLWHVPYHNTCIHFDLFESSICLSHFQLVYWHSQFVYLHCSIINLHFPIVALYTPPTYM